MALKMTCPYCGRTGEKIDFNFLSHADSAGANTYRKCPECHKPVYCDEVAEGEDYAGTDVWGTSRMRGQVFTKKIPVTNGEGE